eukprot:10888667-Lingulodinium_polyedra.AAC.1
MAGAQQGGSAHSGVATGSEGAAAPAVPPAGQPGSAGAVAGAPSGQGGTHVSPLRVLTPIPARLD